MKKSMKSSVQNIAVLVALIMLTGCEHETMQAPSSTSVYVTTIGKTEGIEERWLSATVRARVESDFGFRTGGKILKRLVNVGDRVTCGQALAKLEDADYQLALGVAADQLSAASVDARQASLDADRFQRLVGDGSMGSADLERQKSRSDTANAGMEQARKALKVAQNKNSYTTLKAPYNGVVTAMSMEIGQVVAEGVPIVSLAKDDEREVVTDLPEYMVNQARQFKAKALSWDNNEISVALHLRELSPLAASQGRTYRARYAPKSYSAMEHLPLGSTIQLQLSRPAVSGTALPLSALVKTAGELGVWVLNSAGNGIAFVKVNVLSYGTDTVRVAGLTDNMRIVTVGAQKLDASMKVRPIERTLENSDDPSAKGDQ
ncbi:MAG: efflux RND transporter periplasmic adaptor subunit [Campylobacterales bacterium]|nr:efflux RND transporter periplasmic adaptor subunit [Campylobacterales bacterium]